MDPTNRFLTDNTFDEHLLVVPKIYDEDDFLIYPDEYQLKIQPNSIVLVNVHFKMYVFRNKGKISFHLFIYFRKVDESFHRDYQMILNSMKIIS